MKSLERKDLKSNEIEGGGGKGGGGFRKQWTLPAPFHHSPCEPHRVRLGVLNWGQRVARGHWLCLEISGLVPTGEAVVPLASGRERPGHPHRTAPTMTRDPVPNGRSALAEQTWWMSRVKGATLGKGDL